MRRFLRRCVFVVAAASTLSCEQHAVDQVELEPPSGAASGIVALARSNGLEVVAFDVNTPHDLPFLDRYDSLGPIRVVARYYPEPLAALGLEAGRIAPRTTEDAFGPIPRSPAFPEDQWLDFDGEVATEAWSTGTAGPPFSTFVSPSLPIDREACLDLEVVATLVPEDGSSFTRVAGLAPNLAIVTYASGRSERIYVVREEAGEWSSRPIEAEHFLARIVSERGSISFLSSDGEGGVLVGDCRRVGTTYTSTVWQSPSFDAPFTPLFTESGASQCPAELVSVSEDEWAMRRHGGRVAWVREARGRIVADDFEVGRTSAPLVLVGNELFALDAQNRVHVYGNGEFAGTEVLPTAVGELVGLITRLGSEPVALARRDEVGRYGNAFYLRGASGEWRAWTSVNTQLGYGMSPLLDTILFTVTFGQALQLSPREGLCPEQNDASTAIYVQSHLVALDERTFLVAGYSNSDNAPARIAILRARPQVPSGEP